MKALTSGEPVAKPKRAAPRKKAESVDAVAAEKPKRTTGVKKTAAAKKTSTTRIAPQEENLVVIPSLAKRSRGPTK